MHHDSIRSPDQPHSWPSRRTALTAAAWAAPVLTVATAAPAFATSPGTSTGSWGVASDSWRGSSPVYALTTDTVVTRGHRSDVAFFDMNFIITPTAGAVLNGLKAVLAFKENAADRQIWGVVSSVRNHLNPLRIEPSTWTTTATTATGEVTPGAGLLGKAHTFTSGATTGPTTLRFHMSSVGYVTTSATLADEVIATITFSATGLPNIAYNIHRSNVGTSLTDGFIGQIAQSVS